MLLGDKDKFAFIIERIPEWEIGPYKSGIMFVIVNNDIYPKQVRTTTFNCELPELLDPGSAFIGPIIDKELYQKTDEQIIEFMDDPESDNWYRSFIPFHEIEDSGFRFYILSDGENVKMLICKMEIDNMVFVDKLELSVKEYDEIKKQVIDFYDNAGFE